MRIKWHFLYTLLAFYSIGCSPLGSENVKYDPVFKGDFEARHKPAVLTSLTKADLIQQDYVDLGNLSVELVTEVCHNTGKDCKKVPNDADSTQILLQQAAKRGADLVMLEQDKNFRIENTYTSVCVSYTKVLKNELYCPPDSRGVCYLRQVWKDQCERERSVLSGTISKNESSGSIWRKDPELAKVQKFMFAVKAGDIAQVRRALNAGLNINTRDASGDTALHVAARVSQLEIINLLLSRGFQVDTFSKEGATSLMEAARFGQVGAINTLLKAGANVNAQFTGRGEYKGYTPLMFAARSKADSVRAILAARPDGGIKNAQNMTAHDVAIRFGYDSEGIGGTEAYSLVMAYLHGAWGYIDKTGNIVIPPMFFRAENFSDGMALVKIGSAWGYINKNGIMVIEPKFKSDQWFSHPSDFSEGLAAVRIGKRWGYIDKKGQVAIEPTFGDDTKLSSMVGPFSEGLAAVSVNDMFNKGFVNKSGQIVIEPSYFSVGKFSDGLAWVSNIGKGNGYIDRQGKFIIKQDPKFIQATDFSEGLAAVNVEGKWGFIDKTGKMMIKPQFDAGTYYNPPRGFTEGLCAVWHKDKWGIIDKKGEWVVQPSYTTIEPFSEGMALFLRDGLVGYINKTGREVVPPKYKNGTRFSNGLAAVREHDKYGYIDKQGRYVIEPVFESAEEFSEGLAGVKINDKGLTFLMK